jgi:UDP-N-acetylmuramate dehydrogenase
MKVLERPSLEGLNTFGMAARAGLLLVIENEEDVLHIPRLNPSRDLVLGGGSNVLFVDDVPGTVVMNRIAGISILEENTEQTLVEVGAGESWHGLVTWSVEAGYRPENLALIPGLQALHRFRISAPTGSNCPRCCAQSRPGTRGAAGMYAAAQCKFSYRNSVLNLPPDAISNILCLCLSKNFIPQLEYAGLAESLHQAGSVNRGRRCSGCCYARGEANCPIRSRAMPVS